MQYGYTVKHNGVLYPAGADVPADIADSEEVEDAPKNTRSSKGKATK
jgi:hypothetical protein